MGLHNYQKEQILRLLGLVFYQDFSKLESKRFSCDVVDHILE